MGHEVNHIIFFKFRYKYPNLSYKIYNFFLKNFKGKNLKNIYYGKEIIRQIESLNQIQDVIITIKGDFIDPDYLLKLKNHTQKSVAFFNDSIARYPKTADVLHCFDEVYSFEKNDCEKHGLKFKTNFIYKSEIVPQKAFKYDLFNISTIDKRVNTIINIAKTLFEKNINYKILIYDGSTKIKNNNYISLIRKPISLSDVQEYIKESKVLLDLQRKKQEGLTFRVFESLGLQKKLITTNKDIINYDFYNPNNILVIDENQPEIPSSFFETEYQAVPEEILEKYLIKNWTKDFLKL